MPLTIEAVRSRTEVAQFISLPRRLYIDIPGYIAPLDYERREMLDPLRSSFFTHGHARYWIARTGTQIVGRISAQIDYSATNSDFGMFGCLDAIDDPAMIAGLLRTAEKWLISQGRHCIQGPYLLSINGEPGLLLDGQSEHPVTLLAWHPTYIQRSLREDGYRPIKKMVSPVLDMRILDFERLTRVTTRYSNAGITVRDMNWEGSVDLELARRLFNDSWRTNWGFVPVSQSDIHYLVKSFRNFLLPDSGFFIEIYGRPAALAITIPNLFELVRQIGPSPSILGWLKLLYSFHRPSFSTYSVILLGVSSAFQGSLIGARIATLAVTELARRMRIRGAKKVVASWVLEDNQAMLSVLKNLGFRTSRSFGIFQKQLDVQTRNAPDWGLCSVAAP